MMMWRTSKPRHEGKHFASPFFFGAEMAEWPPFDWADPLLLASSLREDEKLIQASARRFAESRLMPQILEMHRHERFDPALLAEMGALGLLGSTIPEFGGISPVAYGLIAREFERIDSSFRSSLSVQSSLVMHPIHAFGSEMTHSFRADQSCRTGNKGNAQELHLAIRAADSR